MENATETKPTLYGIHMVHTDGTLELCDFSDGVYEACACTSKVMAELELRHIQNLNPSVSYVVAPIPEGVKVRWIDDSEPVTETEPQPAVYSSLSDLAVAATEIDVNDKQAVETLRDLIRVYFDALDSAPSGYVGVGRITWAENALVSYQLNKGL